MAKQRYTYAGPAAVLQHNGKLLRPGDTVTLEDAELRSLANPPYGNGIHVFTPMDGKQMPAGSSLPPAQPDTPLWAPSKDEKDPEAPAVVKESELAKEPK